MSLLVGLERKALLVAIGGILKDHRNRLDFTQTDIAERCGVSIMTQSRLETGGGEVRCLHFIGVCQALGLSIDNVVENAEHIAQAQLRGLRSELLSSDIGK